MAMDLDKLTKLLMLTTSDKDFEALAAIRKANLILAAANLNWEGFLRPRRAETQALDWMTGGRQRQKEGPGDHDHIEEMFEVLMRTSTGTFRDFVEGVHEF